MTLWQEHSSVVEPHLAHWDPGFAPHLCKKEEREEREEKEGPRTPCHYSQAPVIITRLQLNFLTCSFWLVVSVFCYLLFAVNFIREATPKQLNVEWFLLQNCETWAIAPQTRRKKRKRRMKSLKQTLAMP